MVLTTTSTKKRIQQFCFYCNCLLVWSNIPIRWIRVTKKWAWISIRFLAAKGESRLKFYFTNAEISIRQKMRSVNVLDYCVYEGIYPSHEQKSANGSWTWPHSNTLARVMAQSSKHHSLKKSATFPVQQWKTFRQCTKYCCFRQRKSPIDPNYLALDISRFGRCTNIDQLA